MHRYSLAGLLGALLIALPFGVGAADGIHDRRMLPLPIPAFTGKLEATEAESTAVFPSAIKAPDGAPNILLVMTDDVGFAAASTFGGPVPTPNLDQLAQRGLRYNRFHTTGVCSPTRASLLTGRNHHAVGSATVVELQSPYPGYTAIIPDSAATIARILRDNGYSTAMFGKDHNVPNSDRSLVGPFGHWPTGRGFEYFFGFVGGDSDQWRPALFENTRPVSTAQRKPNYLFDAEMADRAINWLHNQQAAAPERPFFMYYAPGSAHAPHQAPPDWIAQFRGQFDQGWDQLRNDILAQQKRMGVVPADTELSARPKQIPAWDSLSRTQQRIYARYMEVFAAMLSYQDAQFGRVIAELERMGLADNTMVMFVQGDNGASGEGGPHGTLNELQHLSTPQGEHPVAPEWLLDNLDVMGGPDTYQGFPVGWAYATSTPFPWVKQLASHLGGVRNGLVVSWPRRIKGNGELRPQYHHVIDIMPTLLEAATVPLPERVDGVAQQPVDGTSMFYSFASADAASTHQTQYYELMGNRAIYHEGWLAGTTPRNMPWNVGKPRPGSDITSYAWELYDLRTDFSQANNLAEKYPQRLQQLQTVFDQEARRYQVYPIQDSGGQYRARRMSGAGLMARIRPEYVYWGRDIFLQLASAPPIFFLPFSVQAELNLDEGNNGVIVAAGSHFGGWSFYLDDGTPTAVVSVSPLPGGATVVEASKPINAGSHSLRFDFKPKGGGGELLIFVDGKPVGRGDIANRPLMMAGLGESFDIGRDTHVPVTKAYENEG
ncbi:MAG: arylsulfatase, partial [Pseudomonadales bacterium]